MKLLLYFNPKVRCLGFLTFILNFQLPHTVETLSTINYFRQDMWIKWYSQLSTQNVNFFAVVLVVYIIKLYLLWIECTWLLISFQDYDIAIWSATSMKWITEKMKLLGVSSHEHYKIAFYLDYLAMISVQTPKYGVVQVFNETKCCIIIYLLLQWKMYHVWCTADPDTSKIRSCALMILGYYFMVKFS